MPIFLFLVLAGGELAFLVASQFSFQRGVDLLADAAAEGIGSGLRADPPSVSDSWRPGWNAMARDEDQLRDCGDTMPDIEYPDGKHEAGDRVRVVWHCIYHPHITSNLWGSLSLTVVGESVIRK
jgi:hypothetical protein